MNRKKLLDKCYPISSNLYIFCNAHYLIFCHFLLVKVSFSSTSNTQNRNYIITSIDVQKILTVMLMINAPTIYNNHCPINPTDVLNYI